MRNNGFTPCYNYFVIDDKFILRLEVPGNASILVNYKIGEKFNIIEVKGEKKKDRDPINLQDNIANDREFGEFAIDIPIMMYLDSSIKPEINVDKGICTIK